jgi:hypothetical protein
MPDFDSVKTCIDQQLESLPSTAFARMCPHCQSAGFMCDFDRILDREPRLGHKRRTTVSKVANEGVLEILHRTAPDQRASNVRTADRATLCLLQNLVERYLYAKSVQLLDNCLRALVPQRTELCQPLLERLDPSEVKRKKVDLVIILKRAQLAAGHNPDAESITGLTRGGNARNAVVIRERQSGEIAALGRFDDTLRRECSVGRG